MKRKPKVENPVNPITPEKEKTFDELLDEQLELSKKMLALTTQKKNLVDAPCKKVKEEIQKINAKAEVTRKLGSSRPEMEARTYSYNELLKMSWGYSVIDPLWSAGLECILRGYETKIHQHFNGDTSKVKFWSHSLLWRDIEMITDEYSTKNMVQEKRPVVCQRVSNELEDFKSRHLN